jgi:NADPH:quinone reductase-like Zn-dependent oxidoreductase
MTTTKTITVNRYGDLDVLEVKETPLPEPGPDEARIKVLVAGVAFGDIQLRKGVSPQALMVKRPFVPGFDIVGTVDELGVNVSSVKRGQTRGKVVLTCT